MPKKKPRIPSVDEFHTHFVQTLNRIQYIEQDSVDHADLAFDYLRELNEILTETWELLKYTEKLPSSVAVDTKVFLGLVWRYLSDSFFKCWNAVRRVSPLEPPGIGTQWVSFEPEKLSTSPDLSLLAASIRQFLSRYRVAIEIHTGKLAAISRDPEAVQQFIEIGWPVTTLTRGTLDPIIVPSTFDGLSAGSNLSLPKSYELEAGRSQHVAPLHTSDLHPADGGIQHLENTYGLHTRELIVSRAQLVGELQKDLECSHTKAYDLIYEAVNRQELAALTLDKKGKPATFHMKEAAGWLAIKKLSHERKSKRDSP